MRRVIAILALALASAALAGCSTVGYYWQSLDGHVRLMAAARPLDDWLQDPAAPERLKERLRLAERIRDFASRELLLPDNPSYRRYADLRRPAAVWNVVAAPPLSLTLRTWCFPVTGCVGYRGWFDEAQARAEAEALRAQGLEVSVYPVPAYSTLGWSNWLGGDPLLNTFIRDTEGELARLIFHELAHQVVYARDDTAFNESFATAVERLGVARWIDWRAREAEEGGAPPGEGVAGSVRRAYEAGERRLPAGAQPREADGQAGEGAGLEVDVGQQAARLRRARGCRPAGVGSGGRRGGSGGGSGLVGPTRAPLLLQTCVRM